MGIFTRETGSTYTAIPYNENNNKITKQQQQKQT